MYVIVQLFKIVKDQNTLAEAIGSYFKTCMIIGERIKAAGPIVANVRSRIDPLVFAIIPHYFKQIVRCFWFNGVIRIKRTACNCDVWISITVLYPFYIGVGN